MPGPDTVLTGPPGWVVAAFQFAVSRPDSSSVESAQIRAANQAGYTRAAGYTQAQQIAVGQGIRSADAFALGQGGGPGSGERGTMAGPRNLPVVIPQPSPVFSPPVPSPGPPYQPPPPGSGGSGSSGIPPQPPRSSPPINPNAPPVAVPVPVVGVSWPWIAASVLGPYVVPTVTQGGQAARDWIKAGRPLPKGPKTRRPRSPHRGPGPKTQADQGNPFPPKGPDAPRPERIPRGERVAAVLAQLGGDIWVNPKRLPVPRQPRPRAVPPPPPPPKPLWLTLLPLVGPSLLGFLQPSQGNRTVVRLTDPLTRPQTDGNPFPLTGVQTSVQNYSSFGPPSGGAGTQQCECKTPRKKGRKKKRTVCYSGTFIERRDGTRKTKKRKVQCL